MGSEPAEMAAAAVKMVEQGRRGDKEYRKVAYKSQTPDWFREKLRLPGGEQLAPSDPDSCETAIDAVNAITELAEAPARDTAPARTFSAIDINLACPVKKISTKSRGGHWLTDPNGAIELLEAVREALPARWPMA